MDKNSQIYTLTLSEIYDFQHENKIVLVRWYKPWMKCTMTFGKVLRCFEESKIMGYYKASVTSFDDVDITDTPFSETVIFVFIGGELKGTVNYKYGQPDCDDTLQYIRQIEKIIHENKQKETTGN